jgi:hypothetical protein
MKRVLFRVSDAVAISGAMETRDHSKNGASSKSQESRRNLMIKEE